MKRIILILICFITLTLVGCSTKETNISINIDDPKGIKIDVKFTPTKYSITDSENNMSEYDLPHTIYPTGLEKTPVTSQYSNGYVIFHAYRFNTLKPGNYKLNIYNEENCKTVNLNITSTFNYIDIENIFKVSESKYYVFILKDGCSSCNKVKPILLEYSKNYSDYSMEENYPLYAVHRSHIYNIETSSLRVNIIGIADNLIDVSNYSDIKITGFPRVVLIENGKITKVYKVGDILNHFQK